MNVGDRLTLACDAQRPRRTHIVVRVDADGAWLREEFDDRTFCIGANAEHTLVDLSQGVLW